MRRLDKLIARTDGTQTFFHNYGHDLCVISLESCCVYLKVFDYDLSRRSSQLVMLSELFGDRDIQKNKMMVNMDLTTLHEGMETPNVFHRINGERVLKSLLWMLLFAQHLFVD